LTGGISSRDAIPPERIFKGHDAAGIKIKNEVNAKMGQNCKNKLNFILLFCILN